jgi:sialate O-acetylesterase
MYRNNNQNEWQPMNRYKHIISAGQSLATIFLLAFVPASAQEWRRAVSLRGEWKFEIGDDPAYSARDYDDSRWEKIHVPGAWENQGFPGYDGYAWYRKSFQTPAQAQEYLLYVHFGSIDDVDEAYINGKLIGYQGWFPPRYETAYNFSRNYLIPKEFLDPSGKNVIAVRVYDDELAGGIMEGDIGIFYSPDQLQLSLRLDGFWKLQIGDDDNYALPDWDDSGWQQVAVPSYWDSYGHKNYDGIGWYRKSFRLPRELANEKLILILGKIDDVDEVYLNGKLLGKTGRWPDRPNYRGFYDDYYQQNRAYFIPTERLLTDQENAVAVRVFDAMLHGGIWDGPVGLATRQQYRRWQTRQSSIKDFFFEIFK